VTHDARHTTIQVDAIECGHQNDLASHIVGGGSNQSCCSEPSAPKAHRLVSPDRDCRQTLSFEETAEGRRVGGEI
jgi:hypothetical protein